MDVRRLPDSAFSEQVRRFNAPILEGVMDSDEYLSIKTACEERQIPTYEAASEFISQAAGNLDDLLE